MKEFNKFATIIPYTIGEVEEKDLNCKIYGKMMEIFNKEFISNSSEEYKYEILDMFVEDSYVNENKLPQFNYTSTSEKPFYIRDNKNVCVDLICSPNSIPVDAKKYNYIFSIGNKCGYGIYHASLFEIERIIKSSGILCVSLSKYLFYKEINQIIFLYRNWEFVKSYEILYKIIENKVESSKFFNFYKYNG